MQNRITLSDIPSIVPKLPNSLTTLRDLLEEHGCWVDRITFFSDKNNNDTAAVHAVAEFHIENVRDSAIESLNNNATKLALDQNGDPSENNKEDDDAITQFTICASPATQAQSNFLVKHCPIEEEEGGTTRNHHETQVLKLALDIELQVHRSKEAGGTGTDPWRGGVILAQHVIQWYEMEQIIVQEEDEHGLVVVLSFASLFRGKRILELGAGSSGLPSMALAKLLRLEKLDAHPSSYINSLIATDGVDEIVRGLQTNITCNNLEDMIRVQHLNWSDDDAIEEVSVVDTILFADCIYNEQGANALFRACWKLLSLDNNAGSCNVIGVLPDFRVGINLFENKMQQSGFRSKLLPRIIFEEKISNTSNTSCSFVCSGSAGTHYRIMWWRR